MPLSAARLTQGVPWLCVPLSREVCLFDCFRNGECTQLIPKSSGTRCRTEVRCERQLHQLISEGSGSVFM